MLKVGDKIICGGKRAKEFSYDSCVGREGEIVSGPHTSAGVTHLSVKFKGLYGRWGIIIEDCISHEPTNNREALSRLESDY